MIYDTGLRPLDLDIDSELREIERVSFGGPQARFTYHRQRARTWLLANWLDLVLIVDLLCLVGIVHAIGMYHSPARFDDEGTYTAYAWAVQNLHKLGHYTYWYAHPPLGWIQIAGWTTLTRGFQRAPYAVAATREFMLVCQLVSSLLLYLLARRLRFTRVGAAGAVLMFGLSPLAVYFQRAALLDNIVTPWLLASFWLAASPRRSLRAAAGSAACFAVAVLTKETALLFLPALALLFWQHLDRRNRRFAMTMFGSTLAVIGVMYPLYALIKNEFFEGSNHVSLIWAIKWQLFDRVGSGSIFDPKSTAHTVVHSWFVLDPWLPKVVLLLAPLGLAFRRTRAISLAFAIQAAELLRSGYLPYPFVVAMIPFGALLTAGVFDEIWRRTRVRRLILGDNHLGTPRADTADVLGGTLSVRQDVGRQRSPRKGWRHRTRLLITPILSAARWVARGPHPSKGYVRGFQKSSKRRGRVVASWANALCRVTVALAVLATVGGLAVRMSPSYRAGLNDLQRADRDAGKRLALAWLERNVQLDERMVVDDSLWVDLVRHGFAQDQVIWFTKLDVDRDVRLPKRRAWAAINYITLDHQDELSVHLNNDGTPSPATLAEYPTLGNAVRYSTVVGRFGSGGDQVTIRRVEPSLEQSKGHSGAEARASKTKAQVSR